MPETVDALTDELTIAKYFLKNFADNIILCHLIGLDLLAYNNHLNKHQRAATSIQQPTNDDQSLINDTCVTLNQTITIINGDDNLQSPFLQDTIHCLVKGKRIHKYIRSGTAYTRMTAQFNCGRESLQKESREIWQT